MYRLQTLQVSQRLCIAAALSPVLTYKVQAMLEALWGEILWVTCQCPCIVLRFLQTTWHTRYSFRCVWDLIYSDGIVCGYGRLPDSVRTMGKHVWLRANDNHDPAQTLECPRGSLGSAI